MSQLIEDLEKLVTPLLSSENVELVDLTHQKSPNGRILCFTLDKPGGITLDDCTAWSRKIGDLLDQSDVLKDAYKLEVSSPGIYRVLKKDSDFERFAGERVQIKTFAPVNGQRNFKGILTGISNGMIQLTLENKLEVKLPKEQIAKANLDPVIEI